MVSIDIDVQLSRGTIPGLCLLNQDKVNSLIGLRNRKPLGQVYNGAHYSILWFDTIPWHRFPLTVFFLTVRGIGLRGVSFITTVVSQAYVCLFDKIIKIETLSYLMEVIMDTNMLKATEKERKAFEAVMDKPITNEKERKAYSKALANLIRAIDRETVKALRR